MAPAVAPWRWLVAWQLRCLNESNPQSPTFELLCLHHPDINLQIQPLATWKWSLTPPPPAPVVMPFGNSCCWMDFLTTSPFDRRIQRANRAWQLEVSHGNSRNWSSIYYLLLSVTICHFHPCSFLHFVVQPRHLAVVNCSFSFSAISLPSFKMDTGAFKT